MSEMKDKESKRNEGERKGYPSHKPQLHSVNWRAEAAEITHHQVILSSALWPANLQPCG